MFCRGCGKSIDSSMRICAHCGREVDALSGGTGFWELLDGASAGDARTAPVVPQVRPQEAPVAIPEAPKHEAIPVAAPADAPEAARGKGLGLVAAVVAALALLVLLFTFALSTCSGAEGDVADSADVASQEQVEVGQAEPSAGQAVPLRADSASSGSSLAEELESSGTEELDDDQDSDVSAPETPKQGGSATFDADAEIDSDAAADGVASEPAFEAYSGLADTLNRTYEKALQIKNERSW